MKKQKALLTPVLAAQECSRKNRSLFAEVGIALPRVPGRAIKITIAAADGCEEVDAISTRSDCFALRVHVLLPEGSGTVREFYSITHVPTGMKVADWIASDATAHLLVGAIAGLPHDWRGDDPYAFIPVQARLPKEIKSWTGILGRFDYAELDAANKNRKVKP